MSIKHYILKSPQYENCEILNPNGQLMFRCSKKKFNWYLNKNLAIKTKDNPLTAQLTFNPKGQGHINDSYYLQKMKNNCVVCGSLDNLTKHHIVPHCYRKFFPVQNKEHNSYDVMALCVYCHRAYEDYAAEYKQILSEKYNAPLGGVGFKYDRQAAYIKNLALTLLSRSDKVPISRQQELFSILETQIQRTVSWGDLYELSALNSNIGNNYVSHGKIVMDSVENLQDFVQAWRKHFLDKMNPKFLPDDWYIDRPV